MNHSMKASLFSRQKCQAKLKEAEAVGIRANQAKEVVVEEVLAEYESIRDIDGGYRNISTRHCKVLGEEGQQSRVGSGAELSEAANGEEQELYEM